jgi:FkbM family methyltransferase
MTFRSIARRLIRLSTGLEVIKIGEDAAYVIPEKRLKRQEWLPHSAMLKTMFRDLDVNLVIDVGANQGQFGGSLREFYDGPIISFEPVADTFERLQATAAGDSQWTVVRSALGDRDSTMTMRVPRNSVFSSLLPLNDYSARHFGQLEEESRSEEVQVRRLDDLLQARGIDVRDRRLFLKLDTQGFDLQVFDGARGILDTVVAMQSEVSLVPIYEGMPHWTTSVARYEAAGYAVAAMYPVTREAWRVIEFDCLLVKIPQAAIDSAG